MVFIIILTTSANGGALKFEDEFIQRCMNIIGGASKQLNQVEKLLSHLFIYLYIYLFKSFSGDGYAQLFITGTEPSDNGEGFAFIKESHRKF